MLQKSYKKVWSFFQNEGVLVSLIFLLAVCVRFLAISSYGGFAVFNSADTESYVYRAQSLLQGQIVTISAIGFSAYLAMIFKISGGVNLEVVRILNLIVSSATVVIFYFIGKRFYNKLTGILSALICMFHVNLIFWSGYVSTETLFIFFLAVSMCFFLRFADDKKSLTLLPALISLAITGLVRDIGFLLFIPVLGWILFVLFKQRFVRWGIGIFFAVFILLVPFFVTFMVIPDQQGALNWKNNTISGEILKGLLWDENGRATFGVDICPENLPLKIAEYNRNPGDYTKLMLRKLKTYWWIFTPESSWRHRILSCSFLIPLYLFAVWGLISSFRIREKTILLVSIVGMFTLASMVGIVDYDLRYHLPVEAVLIAIAAYGVQCSFEVMKARM